MTENSLNKYKENLCHIEGKEQQKQLTMWKKESEVEMRATYADDEGPQEKSLNL